MTKLECRCTEVKARGKLKEDENCTGEDKRKRKKIGRKTSKRIKWRRKRNYEDMRSLTVEGRVRSEETE
jgi:hypothetical protein